MTEPIKVGEGLPSPSPPEYLEANELVQQAMLFLVEYCHRPSYQATLDLSLQSLDEVLSSKPALAGFTPANENVLRLVLRACYDTDREKTLVNMRESFGRLNAGLRAANQSHQDGG